MSKTHHPVAPITRIHTIIESITTAQISGLRHVHHLIDDDEVEAPRRHFKSLQMSHMNKLCVTPAGINDTRKHKLQNLIYDTSSQLMLLENAQV